MQVAKVGWAEQHSRLFVQLAMPPPALHGNGSLLFSCTSRCMVGAWLLLVVLCDFGGGGGSKQLTCGNIANPNAHSTPGGGAFRDPIARSVDRGHNAAIDGISFADDRDDTALWSGRMSAYP